MPVKAPRETQANGKAVKRPRISVSVHWASDPIEIPRGDRTPSTKGPRITALENLYNGCIYDDDDVFTFHVDSAQGKENAHVSLRLSPSPLAGSRSGSKRPRWDDSSTGHHLCPAPAPTRTEVLHPSLTSSPNFSPICVNSPGRRELQSRSPTSLSDLKCLGKGGFGSVILGSWKGRRVAVKVIAKGGHLLDLNRNRAESVARELNGLNFVHNHLVQMFGVFTAEDMHTVIIMEYVGKSNLQTIIEKYPTTLTSQFLLRCFCEMSDALGYVHSKGFLHLDFKPANIFVSASGVFKLGDFGCCRAAPDANSKVRESILVGTPGYQAPEYLKNHSPTVKCDTYAFGVTVWQLVARETPFRFLHPHVIIYQVVALGKRPSSSKGDVISPFKELYHLCWHQDPAKRPTMLQVFKYVLQMKIEQPKRKSPSGLRF